MLPLNYLLNARYTLKGQKGTRCVNSFISKNDANWDHPFFKKENERAYIYSNLLSFLTISGCTLLHVKKQENSMYVSCQLYS